MSHRNEMSGRAGLSRLSGVPASAALLVVIVTFGWSQSANAGNFFSGQKVYDSYCKACHGASGQGEMPGAPNFSTGRTLMQPDLSLYTQIRDGKNAMPGFRGVLTENEILDVITYIRSFY